MKKLLLACFALALSSSALVGCRAEAEVDPDGKVSSYHALPR